MAHRRVSRSQDGTVVLAGQFSGDFNTGEPKPFGSGSKERGAPSGNLAEPGRDAHAKGSGKSVIVDGHDTSLAGEHFIPGLIEGVALASIDRVEYLDGLLQGLAIGFQRNHQLGKVLLAEVAGDKIGLLGQLDTVHGSLLMQGHHYPTRIPSWVAISDGALVP